MKKSKLSIGLVTSFIGALALTSCNSTPAVTSSKESIVDFVGYNSEDEKITIDIDKFYSEYGESEEGTTLFYNAVLEALIRYEYKGLSAEDQTLKSYESIEKEAKEKVTTQKRVAEVNANSSGKKYEEEWEAILESHNCETEEDLKEYFMYELEKEAINEWYYKKNQENVGVGDLSLMDQYLGIDSSWKTVKRPLDASNNDTHEYESVFPYHILHVLVKLGADATDYSRATITSAEAEKLWNVVRKLMDSSYTFEEVAFKESEDSSNTAYGDVGMMSTQTSFYNEFKLGIYAYDALLSGVNTLGNDSQGNSNEAIYSAFGIDNDDTVVTKVILDADGKAVETKEPVKTLAVQEMTTDVQNAVTGYGDTDGYAQLPTIPYEVFKRIGELKDEEKIGTFEPEAGAVAYPRNILFNQFLNFRSPFVITNEDITITADVDKVTTAAHDFTNDAADNFYLPENNFVADAVPALAGKSVLTDGNGNVIIGVRSTAGIHFMVMRKSVFYETNKAVTRGTGTKADVTLQDYYTTASDVTAADYPAETYVNMTKSDDSSYYTNRINTIKNKLKGQDSSDVFDAAYDYRIYQMLYSRLEDEIKFFDENETTASQVEANIEEKIKLLREAKWLSNADTINNAWGDYLAQLRHQNKIRSYKGMLSTGCVFRWGRGNDADKKEFEKDGVCYVK
jgi:hypothetical protein